MIPHGVLPCNIGLVVRFGVVTSHYSVGFTNIIAMGTELPQFADRCTPLSPVSPPSIFTYLLRTFVPPRWRNDEQWGVQLYASCGSLCWGNGNIGVKEIYGFGKKDNLVFEVLFLVSLEPLMRWIP